MSMNRTKKITLLAAAAVALLAVTVSAAVLWLTPAQVAVELNDPMLAEAFQSEAAVILNETQTVGDYTVTLMGMVSGSQHLPVVRRCPGKPHLCRGVRGPNGRHTPDRGEL